MWPNQDLNYSSSFAPPNGEEVRTTSVARGRGSEFTSACYRPTQRGAEYSNNAGGAIPHSEECSSSRNSPLNSSPIPRASPQYPYHFHHVHSINTAKPILSSVNDSKREHPTESPSFILSAISSARESQPATIGINSFQYRRNNARNAPVAPHLCSTGNKRDQPVKITNHRPYTLLRGSEKSKQLQLNTPSPDSFLLCAVDTPKKLTCLLCSRKARVPVPPNTDTASFFSTDGKVIWTAPLRSIEQLPSKEKNITRLVCCANFRAVPDEDSVDVETVSALDELTSSLSPTSTTFSHHGLSFLTSAEEGNNIHVLNSGTFSRAESQVDDVGVPGSQRNEAIEKPGTGGQVDLMDSRIWKCKYGENCKYVHIKMHDGFPISGTQKTLSSPDPSGTDLVVRGASWEVGPDGCTVQVKIPESPAIAFNSDSIYSRPVHINYIWKDVTDCLLYSRYTASKDEFQVDVEGVESQVPITQFLCTAGMNQHISQFTGMQAPSSPIIRCHSFHGHGYCPEAENCPYGHWMTVDAGIEVSCFKWAKGDVKKLRARPTGSKSSPVQELCFKSCSPERGPPEPPRSLQGKKCPSSQDLPSGSSPSLTVSNSGYGRDSITTTSTLTADRQPHAKSHLSVLWLTENYTTWHIKTVDLTDFSSTSSRTATEMMNSSTTFARQFSSLSFRRNQRNFDVSCISPNESLDKSATLGNPAGSECSSVVLAPPSTALSVVYPRSWETKRTLNRVASPLRENEREPVLAKPSSFSRQKTNSKSDINSIDTQPYQRADTDMFLKDGNDESLVCTRASTTIVSNTTSNVSKNVSSPTRREGSKKVIRHNPYCF